MAKILEFPKEITIEEWFEGCKEELAKAKTAAIVFDQGNGYVMTGYYNCNFKDKMLLAKHIECDGIDQMMNASYELIPKEI